MMSKGGLMCFTDLGLTQMAVRYVILSAGGWWHWGGWRGVK